LSKAYEREELVMANEWLSDARKIPDKVMSYKRERERRCFANFIVRLALSAWLRCAPIS